MFWVEEAWKEDVCSKISILLDWLPWNNDKWELVSRGGF